MPSALRRARQLDEVFGSKQRQGASQTGQFMVDRVRRGQGVGVNLNLNRKMLLHLLVLQ